MTRTFASLLAVALLVLAAPSSAQQPGRLAEAFADVDRLVHEFMAQGHVPGAAWGIIVDGRLAHTGTAGFRDVDSKAPVGSDTVFRIASMTKSFTAMAILKLRDEGKVSLDDPAERYVPELEPLAYPTTDSPRITIRHLLSHAEGFPEDNPWGDRHLADSEEALSAMLRGGIPNVSKMKYGDYVAANILKPLGMASTTLEQAEVPAQKLAHGYRWEDARWKDEPLLSNGSFGSMGGMLTSLSDLGRYVGVLLSAWPARDGADDAPVKRSSRREMQQVWRPAPASVSRDATGAVQFTAGGYGFGLRVSQTCAFQHIVAHSGGLPGFGSVMTWLPDYGVGFIAFGNLTYTGWGRITTSVFDALVKKGGLQPRSPTPSPALTDARNAVAKLVVQWDDAVAKRLAADNLFLDQTSDRRRAAIEALRAQVGACTPGTGFDSVENALRGQWTMNCERGKLQVAITLAPTMPPKVQYLDVRPAPAVPAAVATCR
jgi:CubicO group peptidase (beta-lactamase class C family)